MNEAEIKMWQKLIIGEITNEEFAKFITNRFQALLGMVNVYGLDKALNCYNPNDYPDPELHKLINYYTQHKNLLVNYIKMKSKDGEISL